MLSQDEVARYARHIVLRGLGGPGQQKLRAARVLMIGAGGLGSPALLYLAAAGIGTIGIADEDVVSLSNLQRQVLYGVADIGADKVTSAADRLVEINPHVKVETHRTRVTASTIGALVAPYDVVLDGTDNFEARYVISDGCFYGRKPLITAAVAEYAGTVTTLMPFAAGPDGTPNPTYRCLFPAAPPPDLVPACAATGVLGAMAGVIGTLQALEAIKLIAGIGEPLVGRLVLFDGEILRMDVVRYGWDPANPLNGTATSTASRAVSVTG